MAKTLFLFSKWLYLAPLSQHPWPWVVSYSNSPCTCSQWEIGVEGESL